MKTINLCNDFSPNLGMRYKRTGSFSGEEFRERLLIPALKAGGGVRVELDGAGILIAPFIEGAFGDAVRAGYQLTEGELELVSEDDFLKKRIWERIERARQGEPVR